MMLSRRGLSQDLLIRIRNSIHGALEHLTVRQGERLYHCLPDGNPADQLLLQSQLGKAPLSNSTTGRIALYHE